MKTLIIIAALVTLTTSAFAVCPINLKSEGLSKAQVSEVKTILAKKGYITSRKLQGNENEFSVRIFKMENCIPGLDEIYQTGGGVEIYAPAYNIDMRKDGRYSRIMLNKRLYNDLKVQLQKIPLCR